MQVHQTYHVMKCVGNLYFVCNTATPTQTTLIAVQLLGYIKLISCKLGARPCLLLYQCRIIFSLPFWIVFSCCISSPYSTLWEKGDYLLPSRGDGPSSIPALETRERTPNVGSSDTVTLPNWKRIRVFS